MAALISRMQIAKIYAMSRELGIDNDLLHELVDAQTGCSSLRELTRAQGNMVIDRLAGRNGAGRMATPRQKYYIKVLLEKMGWVREDGAADTGRLEGLLKARFGVDSYGCLTVKKAGEVIEALKQMAGREAAAGKGAGGKGMPLDKGREVVYNESQ